MPNERILKLTRDMEKLVKEQVELKKRLESIENLTRETEELKVVFGAIQEKLQLLDVVLEENRLLKEKIAQLEKLLKEKPSGKKKAVKLDYIFTGVSKAVDSFEKGAYSTGGKGFVVSELEMEVKGFLTPEKGELKIVVPEAGEEISPDILSRINFKLLPSISYGEEWVELPNLVGIDEKEAKRILKELGLKVEVEKVETELPSGIVIETQPEPYVEVKPGTKVKLVLSR